MTKKLLGLLIVALFCITALNAATMDGTCSLTTVGNDPAVNTDPPGITTMPTISGAVFTCIPFTIPAGDTLTGVDINIANDYLLGLPSSTNSVQFMYTMTGFSTTALTTSITGSGTSTSTAGGIVSQAPAASACLQTGADSVDCEDYGLSLTSPPNFGAVTVTGSSMWTAGGVGPGGADAFYVYEVFTYSPTPPPPGIPEPASFLLIGSGLIGLALAGRRKFRA
jgi:hypothetical protein